MMKGRPKQPGTGAGFTLIELIVVFSVMGIVTGLGTSAFFTMTSAWHDAKTLAELDAMAGAAFHGLQEDMADVISADLSGAYVRGFRRDSTDPRFFDRELADDQIILPLQSSGMGQGTLAGGTVLYQVVRSEGRHRLTRSVGEAGAETPLGNPQRVIDGADVLRLRIEYAAEGESGWLPQWQRQATPRAVRVSMTLADPFRPDLQISRKAVFAIYVR